MRTLLQRSCEQAKYIWGMCTLSASLLPSAVVRRAYVQAQYTRQFLTTPDGGTISLDWWTGRHKQKALPEDAPAVLCLHAFAGRSPVAAQICVAH